MNSMKAYLTKKALVLLPRLPSFLAAALCAGPVTGVAGQPAPSGPFGFSFSNPNVPVYDLSGSYQFNHPATIAGGATVNLSLSCSLTQDAAGRLQGSGVTNVQVGNDLLPAQFSVSGTVMGGGGNTTSASFSARWVVQNSTAGGKTSTISIQYTLQVSQGSLHGTARGQAKLAALGNGTISTSVAGLPLPPGGDGSWNLALNLQPPGGTGSITLPNGRSIQANPAVTYSASTGLERVTLSGASTNRATTLNDQLLPGHPRLGQSQRKSPWSDCDHEERGWGDRHPTRFYGSGNSRLRRCSTLP